MSDANLIHARKVCRVLEKDNGRNGHENNAVDAEGEANGCDATRQEVGEEKKIRA